MSEKVTVTMTRDTELTMERAAEFYARALMGQLDYVCYVLIESCFAELPKSGTAEQERAFSELMKRRECAMEKMMDAKMAIWPKLMREGHSYGVGHNREADIAWGVYEVLRYTRAWYDHPNGGITVNFSKPMRWADEPLPECRIEETE